MLKQPSQVVEVGTAVVVADVAIAVVDDVDTAVVADVAVIVANLATAVVDADVATTVPDAVVATILTLKLFLKTQPGQVVGVIASRLKGQGFNSCSRSVKWFSLMYTCWFV